VSLRWPPPIVALSPGEGRARLVEWVRAAWAGGLRGVVLREPALADRDYFELARELRGVVERDAGGWLCLHDRPHGRREVGVDVLHPDLAENADRRRTQCAQQRVEPPGDLHSPILTSL